MQIDDKRACRELHEHLFEVIDFLDREECRDYISAECLKSPEFREQLLDHISRCKHCQDSMYTERFVRSLLARCSLRPSTSILARAHHCSDLR